MKNRQAALRDAADEHVFAHYALGHGQGLLFAYGIEPGRGAQELTVAAAEAALAAGRLVWIHLDLTTTPAKRWIDSQDWLPPEAKEMLAGREDRTQFNAAGQGLAGILCDFHRELEVVDWRVGQLHFYADPHRLITGRRHPLAALDRAQQALLTETKAESGIALLASVVEALAGLLDGATDDLGSEIERVEDHMEQGDVQLLRVGLGDARKRAILFHRQIHRERRAISRLCAKPPAWFRDGDTVLLREIVDRLGATAEDLDTLEVRAKLLQDELAARLAEATNKNLYVLSLVSVVLLPMTLISGIFGMNLGGIPGTDSPLGFLTVVVAIGFSGLVTLLVLRWCKIL